MEIIDRRKEKAAAEAAAPQEAPESLLAAEGIDPASLVGKADTPENVVPFKKTVRGEVQSWKSVGYLPAFVSIGKAQIMVLRAVGIRSDENLFLADYALPPIWEEGEDYVVEAKKRLNTFMCNCDNIGRCKYHGEMLPGPKGPGKWLEMDIKRLEKVQGAAVPEAVEVLMKAEAARAQSRIVVPGGRVQ